MVIVALHIPYCNYSWSYIECMHWKVRLETFEETVVNLFLQTSPLIGVIPLSIFVSMVIELRTNYKSSCVIA